MFRTDIRLRADVTAMLEKLIELDIKEGGLR